MFLLLGLPKLANVQSVCKVGAEFLEPGACCIQELCWTASSAEHRKVSPHVGGREMSVYRLLHASCFVLKKDSFERRAVVDAHEKTPEP